MDDNFKIVYRLLRFLDESADWEEFPHERLKADCFDVTQPRWELLLAQLAKADYIECLTVSESLTGNYSIQVTRPRITLKGMEYLQENSLMTRWRFSPKIGGYHGTSREKDTMSSQKA